MIQHFFFPIIVYSANMLTRFKALSTEGSTDIYKGWSMYLKEESEDLNSTLLQGGTLLSTPLAPFP